MNTAKVTAEELSELTMWEDWQEVVRRSLPNFCASPIYVQQRSPSNEDFERVASYISTRTGLPDPDGKLRDVEFGGLIHHTKACGDVTRMWLDAMNEIDFLLRHGQADKRVVDIGAGYGRLAVPLSKCMRSVTCVDAVSISTELCASYTQLFSPNKVCVMTVKEFLDEPDQYDLAINIHSWNECSWQQVSRWISVLVSKAIPYLFTVSNGSMVSGKRPYATWGGSGNSFLPLLEESYDLVAEEPIGLQFNPHALWHLKKI